MNKRAEKKIKIFREKLGKLQRQLAGAKKQKDDLAEITRLEREIANLNQEIERLAAEK